MRAADLATARTFLFVPGDQPRKFDKALHSGADALVIDLEDAVQPSQRQQARSMIATWFADIKSQSRRPFVLARVNAHDTADYEADLYAMVNAGIDGLVAPKFSLESLDAWQSFRATPVMATVETARGLSDALTIRSVPSCISRLAYGAVDFSADIGVRWSGSHPGLNLARAQVVWASRALGLGAPVDTAYTSMMAAVAYEEDCRLGRLLGYGGKFVIHPSQIAAAESAMSPDTDELMWATRVVRAWEKESDGGRGAFRLDDEMIDEAVVKHAKSLLNEHPS